VLFFLSGGHHDDPALSGSLLFREVHRCPGLGHSFPPMCTCPASYLALRLLIPSRPLRSGVSHPSGGCGLDKLAGGSLESFELNLGT